MVDLIDIEIAYALEEKQIILAQHVEKDTKPREAVIASNIAAQFDG